MENTDEENIQENNGLKIEDRWRGGRRWEDDEDTYCMMWIWKKEVDG